eukprot:41055_1
MRMPKMVVMIRKQRSNGNLSCVCQRQQNISIKSRTKMKDYVISGAPMIKVDKANVIHYEFDEFLQDSSDYLACFIEHYPSYIDIPPILITLSECFDFRLLLKLSND